MFRISNDVQRTQTLASIEGFEKQYARIEKEKGKKVADTFRKGYGRLVKQMEEQIRRYDELRKGLPAFQGSDIRDLGDYLIDARIAAGMTQEELAAKLEVSQPMIYKYEMKHYQGYSFEIIEKAAKALNVQVDFSAWGQTQTPVYSEAKQKNIILYFLHHINNAYLGKTKLMKLLYYADFEFYEQQKRSITGDQYLAMNFGPVPRNAENLLKKMETAEEILIKTGILGSYEQVKYYPNAAPAMDIFDKSELEHIENITKRFEHWTASQMSNQTHEEYPWKTTQWGEVIDYNLALSLRKDPNKV